MAKRKYILLALLFTGILFSSGMKGMGFPLSDFPFAEQQDSDPKEKTMSIEVIINNTSKITLEGVPEKGYLEVYSILGVKVTSKNLNSCIGGGYIELAKGIYILKAGKVAKKIIVR